MDKMSLNEFCGVAKERCVDVQSDFLSINVGTLIEVIYNMARECERYGDKEIVSLVSKLDLALPREDVDVDQMSVKSLLIFSNMNLFNKSIDYTKYGATGNGLVYMLMVMPFILQSKFKKLSFNSVYEKLK